MCETQGLKGDLVCPLCGGLYSKDCGLLWDVGWALPSQGLRGVEGAARGKEGDLCREKELPGGKTCRNDVPDFKGGSCVVWGNLKRGTENGAGRGGSAGCFCCSSRAPGEGQGRGGQWAR